MHRLSWGRGGGEGYTSVEEDTGQRSTLGSCLSAKQATAAALEYTHEPVIHFGFVGECLGVVGDGDLVLTVGTHPLVKVSAAVM